MSDIPSELKYTKSHEWIKVDGDEVIVGITDHAQQLLGDMVFVELPEIGDEVNAGNELGVVESVKAASDFYAPVGGEVAAVNEQLADNPGLLNTAPYDDAWLVKLTAVSQADFEELLDAEAYKELISEES